VAVALEVEVLVEAEVDEDIHMGSPSELEWWYRQCANLLSSTPSICGKHHLARSTSAKEGLRCSYDWTSLANLDSHNITSQSIPLL